MIRYCIVLHQIATYCNGWHQSLPSCKRSWTRYWAVARSWTGCGSWARLRWSITEQWLERLLIYMSMIIYLYIYSIIIIIIVIIIIIIIIIVISIISSSIIIISIIIITFYIMLYYIISNYIIDRKGSLDMAWPDVSSCFILFHHLRFPRTRGRWWHLLGQIRVLLTSMESMVACDSIWNDLFDGHFKGSWSSGANP